MKVYGIGDSNLAFNSYGWAGSLRQINLYHRHVVSYPGGSSKNVVERLKYQTWVAPGQDVVLVTLGINDMVQGIGPIRFVRNHLEIKSLVERYSPGVRWVWMPSHYTGHWKLEVLRYALRITSWFCKDVEFVDLRKFKDQIEPYYYGPTDPFHLRRMGYDMMRPAILAKLMEK